ncbi:MAG: hypothetical protein H8E66_35125 [Planctomycetes bacterium]|nr:hypothetical protein [Planctomycetota bacterium]
MCQRVIATLCFVASLTGWATAEELKPFVIHEWGTFTVLQDEQGTVFRGVNINEEPLPAFAHRLYPDLVRIGGSHAPLQRQRSKGLPSSFSGATMRMETPIIYIYPPNNEPADIDVQARFQGGWISEWFPSADVVAPGFNSRRNDLGKLTRESQGSISWNNVTVNSEKAIPETNQHVWLAPRNVHAPTLHTSNGEAEKYLFYRGVANIEAPLRIKQNAETQHYDIVRNSSVGSWESSLRFMTMWLVDIPKPGVVAYRKVETSSQQSADGIVATVPSKFSEEQYGEGNLTRLKAEMKSSLISDGLYEDEAEAMLQTWELSYFKSSGTRLFFTMPREWTDHILPMEVSREAKIERVMIGRIELVTGRQRELLKLISGTTISNPGWFWNQLSSFDTATQASMWTALADGSKEITDFNFSIPRDYQAYLQLGRFRESIIANAGANEDAMRIRDFARNYRIAIR